MIQLCDGEFRASVLYPSTASFGVVRIRFSEEPLIGSTPGLASTTWTFHAPVLISIPLDTAMRSL